MLIEIAILCAVAAALPAYQLIGTARDKRRFPCPGRIVSGLHVKETGRGDPPIVLESGLAGSHLGWANVEPELAKLSRVISYDRAGLGWSHPHRTKRTTDAMISDLATVVPDRAIIVAHSFGALLAIAFAHRFPDRVAGLILVDPASAHGWANCSLQDRKRLNVGIALSRRGAMLARLGIVRASLDLLTTGSRVLPRMIGGTAAGKGASTINRLVGEVTHLPKNCAPQIAAHWSNPKAFRAMAAYLECLPDVAAKVLRSGPPHGIPVTILSAETATPAEIAERERLGKNVVVPDSNHWIQIRHPEAVIDAVRSMLGR